MTGLLPKGPFEDRDAFLRAAAQATADIDAGARLRAVATLQTWLPGLERDAVEQAIAAGATWARIAEALGVTRQAVHRKHADARSGRRGTRRERVVERRAFEAWARAEIERAAAEHFERVQQRQAET